MKQLSPRSAFASTYGGGHVVFSTAGRVVVDGGGPEENSQKDGHDRPKKQ